jgi:hypothetical protein
MSISVNNFVALLDQFFNRLLNRVCKNYAFQPILLQEEIKKAINAGVKGFDDGSVLVPNRIYVEMNVQDYDETQKIGKIFHQKLMESATKFIQAEYPNTIIDVSQLLISHCASEDVQKGAFIITTEYVEREGEGEE